MIRLLAVDMDGTCLDRRSRMTDRTLAALRRAAAEGITVVPATGRNLKCLPHRLAAGTLFQTGSPDDAANSGLFRYVISSNGARVTDILEKKTIFKASVPDQTAKSLMEKCRGENLGKKLGIAAHIRHRYLMQGRLLSGMGRLIYGKDAKGVCCVRDLERFILDNDCEVEEFQFYFLTPGAKKQVRELVDGFPELCAAYTDIYAEVFSKSASKGNALGVLRDKLDIRKDAAACIGDGENDLSMFAECGLKIAMGNAVDRLKMEADFITGKNTEDGAAKAIEKYILGHSELQLGT